jgi:hypothetical protein
MKTPISMTKTARYPAKDESGNYIGAIGSQYDLNDTDRQKVRKLLAESEAPLLLSQIAESVDPKLRFNSPRLASLQRYLDQLAPIEVESVFEAPEPTLTGRTRRGRVFKGYVGTPKLKDLIKKGLR